MVHRPQARKREEAAQVHRRIRRTDRSRVAPRSRTADPLLAQIQRRPRAADRRPGRVAPGSIQRQRLTGAGGQALVHDVVAAVQPKLTAATEQ